MVFLLGFRLTATFIILTLATQSGHSSSLFEQDYLPENGSSTVLPDTNEEGLEDNNPNVFQTTQYAVIDFAKLGYKLFKEKLFDALTMLDTFMEMKPLVLRITRTFVLGNDSNSKLETDVTNMSDTGVLPGEIQADQPQPMFETNTESPIQEKESVMQSNEVVDHQVRLSKHYDKVIESPLTRFRGVDSSISNDDKEVKKSSVEHQGFFGTLFSGVGNFFKGIWNWF